MALRRSLDEQEERIGKYNGTEPETEPDTKKAMGGTKTYSVAGDVNDFQ